MLHLHKNKTIKYLKGTAIIVVMLLVVYIFYVNRKHQESINDKRAYKTLTSELLLDNYKINNLADLIDKVIIVKGILKEVHFKNNVYTLYINHEDETFHIMCELEKKEDIKIEHLKVGQNIVVKGIVKGHLLDIILLNCVII